MGAMVHVLNYVVYFYTHSPQKHNHTRVAHKEKTTFIYSLSHTSTLISHITPPEHMYAYKYAYTNVYMSKTKLKWDPIYSKLTQVDVGFNIFKTNTS